MLISACDKSSRQTNLYYFEKMNNGVPTPAELAIKQLKEAVLDLVEVRKEFGDDLFLLRWLKAQKMHVGKAEKMAREWHHWWKTYAENLRTVNVDPELVEDICKYTPKSVCRNGATIEFVQNGQIDLRLLLNKYGSEKVSRYILEEVMNAEKENILWNQKIFDERNSQIITEDSIMGNIFVYDFKNYSIKQASSYKSIQMLIKIARDTANYFPSLGSKCIITNCPTFVVFLVKLVRPILEGTQMSLECYDDKGEVWKEALLRHVHPDNLPIMYGGNMKISSKTRLRY